MTEPVSVYLHIPFCRRLCPYCAFVSSVPQKGEGEAYLARLESELSLRRDEIPETGAKTIYLGGGSPLIFGLDWVARLLALVKRYFFRGACVEWSVETLPSQLKPGLATLLADSGVNRVSLGIQSFNPQVLKAIGREDQLPCLEPAIAALREAGIASLGVDLILGLPGETIASLRAGLETLLELGIDHLSAYLLYLEEGSPWDRDSFELEDWRGRRFYTLLARELRRAGFLNYEVSNYALPGHACRHNLATWAGEPLLGFGLAAVGTAQDHEGRWLRRFNPSDLASYLRGSDFNPEFEVLGPKERYSETLMLGLRSTIGLPLGLDFASDYGYSSQELATRLEAFKSEGLLKIRKNRWVTTLKGRLWLDRILLEVFPE